MNEQNKHWQFLKLAFHLKPGLRTINVYLAHSSPQHYTSFSTGMFKCISLCRKNIWYCAGVWIQSGLNGRYSILFDKQHIWNAHCIFWIYHRKVIEFIFWNIRHSFIQQRCSDWHAFVSFVIWMCARYFSHTHACGVEKSLCFIISGKIDPTLVALLDTRPTSYQEIASLIPARSATLFLGDW